MKPFKAEGTQCKIITANYELSSTEATNLLEKKYNKWLEANQLAEIITIQYQLCSRNAYYNASLFIQYRLPDTSKHPYRNQ